MVKDIRKTPGSYIFESDSGNERAQLGFADGQVYLDFEFLKDGVWTDGTIRVTGFADGTCKLKSKNLSVG